MTEDERKQWMLRGEERKQKMKPVKNPYVERFADPEPDYIP